MKSVRIAARMTVRRLLGAALPDLTERSCPHGI